MLNFRTEQIVSRTLIPGERIILPGYISETPSGKKELIPAREGKFKAFADSGVRRGTRGIIATHVIDVKPTISIPDQELFDAADVGLPLNSDRLHRVENLLDCCFEHIQHLIVGDKDAVEEAKAFMAQMVTIPGIGIHWMVKEYGEKSEAEK
jgi:hypothetical protein